MNRFLPPLLFTLLSLPLFATAGPVDINTADAKTLARELKGVGLARAQAIVEHRAKNGPFKSADDLARVKGVGMRVVDDNRANIRIDRSERAAGEKAGEKTSVAASEKASDKRKADKTPAEKSRSE